MSQRRYFTTELPGGLSPSSSRAAERFHLVQAPVIKDDWVVVDELDWAETRGDERALLRQRGVEGTKGTKDKKGTTNKLQVDEPRVCDAAEEARTSQRERASPIIKKTNGEGGGESGEFAGQGGGP